MSLYDKIISEHGKLGTCVLKSGRFSARLMRTHRLVGEGVHGLPSGVPITVFPVDSLPGAPGDWVRGAGSYACLVDVNWGLWLDFTGNDHLNTAIVPSVKGMNPITGRKLEGVAMEQYKDKCPAHGKPFKDGLYCEECDYRWPPQNYVASPNILWFDGMRSGDGRVRQFVFTEDDRRDIASAIMGKENTVPAFGFAFYEPKKRRELPPSSGPTRGIQINENEIPYAPCAPYVPYTPYAPYTDLGKLLGNTHAQPWWIYKNSDNTSIANLPSSNVYGTTISQCSCKGSSSDTKTWVTCSNSTSGNEVRASNAAFFLSAATDRDDEPDLAGKDVSVGAGAIIEQELAQDPLSCEDWKAEPSGLIRLYFVFPEQFQDILKAGIRDLNGKKDGFLDGLPVG